MARPLPQISARPDAPWFTLLNALRDAGHTGVKEGCAEGDCGACAVVLVDGMTAPARPRAINACLTLAAAVADRPVVPADGLGGPQALHPVQRAIAANGGSQCGYCTPGFVAAIAEAAHRTDWVHEGDLDDALSGNLCRCTGYRPLREALRATAGSRPNDVLASLAATTPRPASVSAPSPRGGFWAPATLEELWWIQRDHPDAMRVAGATDVGLAINLHGARPHAVIALDRLPELRGMDADADRVVLGAGEPLADVEAFTRTELPVVARMLRMFGSRPIKMRATLGGNLANASPVGDLAPVLLALDAHLVARSPRGDRTIAMDDFFVGYRATALAPGELILHASIPRPRPGQRHGAYKVSRRREMDISAVAFAGRVSVDANGCVIEARLAYGGMAATTARARATEQALLGRVWGPDAATAAGASLDRDFTPLSDVRGSAGFRATLARNLLLAFAIETEHDDFVALPALPTATVVTR